MGINLKNLAAWFYKSLQFMVDSTSKILREDGWFLALLWIFNSPVIIESLPQKGEILEGLQMFFLSTFPLSLIVLLLHFIPIKLRIVKRVLQIFIAIVFLFPFLTELFLIYKFDTKLDALMVEILLGTNLLTAQEFLKAYVLEPLKSAKVLIAIVFMICILKKSISFIKKMLSKKIQWVSIFMIIIFLSSMPFWFYRSYKLRLIDEGVIDPVRIYTLLNTTLLLRAAIFVYNFSQYYPIVNRESILEEMNNYQDQILTNNSKMPYVIFVLGEATTRKHMQLYDFRLETTPLLNARYNAGEIVRFNDTIACANNTSRAMSLIFTFSEKNTQMNDWYLKPNLFDILKNAGYHTVWISNQSPKGLWGNFDFIFSNRCDNVVFTEESRRRYDEVILPELDNFLERPYEKNFYLLHIYGTHAIYKDRYPEEFEKFTATDEDKPTDKGKEVTATYHNAILYNDYVMDEIIRRFEDKNAIVIYISDHGEEVYENREFFGHSVEEFGNLSMIEIPFIIWTSKTFREIYPEKVSALAAAVDNPYRTDFIIHTVLDLLDIDTESFDPTKSIFNSQFDDSRLRIYNNKPYTKNSQEA